MKKFLLSSLSVLALGATLAWAANNYRQSTSGGTVTTFKSTDTAGVHVPHVNVDSIPSATPSSSSTTGVSPSATQAAASNSILKATPGIIRDLTVTIGATSGWVMLFNAVALPSNGATGATMVWCYPVNSDGTKGGIDKHWDPPLVMSTGITVGLSSTACNSLTASATGFFYGQVQ